MSNRNVWFMSRVAIHVLAVTVLLLAATPSLSAQSLATEESSSASDAIRSLVSSQADAGLFSGVVFVAQGDSTIVAEAYGYADFESSGRNEITTRFGIASVTKIMTTLVADQLVREGRIELDFPVARYISAFPKGPGGATATIRHLIDHESGVPHRVTNDEEEMLPLSPADIVERVVDSGLAFDPGTDSGYSSAGYTCLARVMEVAAGKSFDELIRDMVLHPAMMFDTVSEPGRGNRTHTALPYRLGAERDSLDVFRTPDKDLRFLTGAGSVYSTAPDLFRFVRALKDGRLGERAYQEAFDGPEDAWQSLYGRTNGFEASVDYLASSDVTFVLVSNLQSASNWQVREQIKNVLLGAPVSPIPMPPLPSEGFESPESIVGTYGPAEITFRDGHLFRGDNEFYPIEGERYYIPGSGSMMRFRKDSTGAVDALVSIRAGSERLILRD